jgi:hypothetical protein
MFPRVFLSQTFMEALMPPASSRIDAMQSAPKPRRSFFIVLAPPWTDANHFASGPKREPWRVNRF